MKIVEYIVTNGIYYAYLPDKDDESLWNWDNLKHSKQEFYSKYESFKKVKIEDEEENG